MKRTIMGAILILGGTLGAAHADAWVFRDTLRPHGHDRSLAVKRADGRRCGASHNMFTDSPAFTQCMLARGWVFDHAMPDPPSARRRDSSSHHTPPIYVAPNDDWVQRQQEQDNRQQMLNQQLMNDSQQLLNDQMFQQQQQMIINQMNNP